MLCLEKIEAGEVGLQILDRGAFAGGEAIEDEGGGRARQAVLFPHRDRVGAGDARQIRDLGIGVILEQIEDFAGVFERECVCHGGDIVSVAGMD